MAASKSPARSPTNPIADQAIAAGIKTLVITGHGLSLKPGSLQPYDYLLKPVRGDELLANIQRCLAEKSGATEIVQFPKSSA